MKSSRLLSSVFVALFVLSIPALSACGGSDDDAPPPNAGRQVEGASPAGSSEGVEETPAPVTSPAPTAPPLGGEIGTWTWLDVPESMCGNGEPTGLGVNLGSGKDLLVVLMGGGGCWDQVTCDALGLAANIKRPYDRAAFEAELGGAVFKDLAQGGIFDRAASSNPFKDSSVVFIPYCTGDLHAGDATQEFLLPPRTMHFAGRKNIDAFLAKIVPAFPSVSRVTWSGFSAGGFGAMLSYWRAQTAFGKIRVDLIDDSGPLVEQGSIPLYPTWRKAWNSDGALPPDCDACRTNIAALTPYYATTYPNSRFAFVSYDQDIVISTFLLAPGPIFASHLRAMATKRIAPTANFRSFIASGTSHGMVGSLAAKSEGVELGDWFTQMVTDSTAWASYGAK